MYKKISILFAQISEYTMLLTNSLRPFEYLPSGYPERSWFAGEGGKGVGNFFFLERSPRKCQTVIV